MIIKKLLSLYLLFLNNIELYIVNTIIGKSVFFTNKVLPDRLVSEKAETS